MYKFLSFIFTCLPLLISGQEYQKLNMTLQSRISGQPGATLTDIWGYSLNGDEYAIVGSRDATNIYNVNDCASPVLDTALIDGYNSSWRDYKVHNGYAYAVCDGADCGLQVIKLTPDTPLSPGEQYTLTSFNSLTRSHNIFIDTLHGRLYAVGTRITPTGSSNNILIYDLNQDPSNPNLLKVFDPGKYTHDIYVEDNIGFCSHGWASQIGIYDFSDIDNIITVGSSSQASGYNHSGWKHPYADVFYVAEEVPIGQPLFIYNIEDLSAPQWSEQHSFKEPLEAAGNNRPHNPFVHGDLLYVSYYHDGLQVWEVSDPYDPVRVAYFDTYYQNDGGIYENYAGAWGVYPFLTSGCILVSDINNGFFTLTMDSYPLSTKVQEGDLIFEDPGAGIIFSTNNGSLVKLYASGGNLTLSEVSSASAAEVNLKNSHISFSQNLGVIFKDAQNGNFYRLTFVNGNPLLLILPSLGNKNLVRLVSGDIHLERKNTGLIFRSSGSCYKLYAGDSGQLIYPNIPCFVD